MLTGASSTFDTAVGGWTAAGGQLAVASDVTRTGAGALGVTSAGGDVWLTSPARPVTPGDIVQGSAFVRAPSARYVVVAIQFLDSAGASLGMTWGEATMGAAGAWTLAQPVAAFVPARTATARLFQITYGTAAGERFHVDDATLSKTSGTPAAVDGPLRASGNRIVDASGATVTLRGIHRDGEQLGRYPTDAEIGRAQQWGSNVVRVPLSESLWLNTCTAEAPTNDPSYPSKIDAVVQSITSRGMVALVELHYNVIAPCGWSSQHSMADARFAPELWRQVAARYKSNELVAFELYNEPHDVSADVWRDGGTVVENGTTYEAAGMDDLADAVRSTGATNLIVAGGLNWASVPPTALLDDGNVAYAAHAYTCTSSAAAPSCSWTESDPVDPTPLLSRWSTFVTQKPVLVTEFGWPDAKAGRYNRNVVEKAEAMGFAGWVAFAWDGGNAGMFSLLRELGADWQPSLAGMPVLAGLTRN